MKTLSDRIIVAAKSAGYTATEDGRVFKPSGIEVKGSRLKNSDHLRITFYVDGVNERGYGSALKHRFIAYYFMGDEVFSYQVVRHKNDIGNDNRLKNLALGSYKDNRADIPREKISVPSKKNAHLLVERSRKLTEEQVKNMRRERALRGLSYKKLGDRFGVTTMTAYRAVNKQSWENVE